MVLIPPSLPWLATAGLGVAASLFLWHQHGELQSLAAERDVVRASLVARAQTPSSPAVQGASAAPTSAAHVDSALAAARSELRQVQQQIAALVQEPPSADTRPPFSAGTFVPASEWRNVGNATPEDALQTVLWAGAGGDVDSLAAHLRFMNTQTETAANDLYRQSQDAAAPYSGPLQLIAALAVPDVPLAAVRVRTWESGTAAPGSPPLDVRIVRLELYSGPLPRTTALLFMKEPGGWKLIVPPEAIARYAAQLNRKD